jgi:hypothetical protein
VVKWRDTMGERIRGLVAAHGALAAKAFPGRAAILVKLLGIDTECLAAVHEKPGSMKIGHYLPGTRIPIRSDDDFFAMAKEPPVILNLAWHISPEINAYLRKAGYRGEIVDILDPAGLLRAGLGMFTVVGSGFGLYGYLPALVEAFGEPVLLPREYEAKIRARPELNGCLAAVRWMPDRRGRPRVGERGRGRVAAARAIGIPPAARALPGLRRLVIEKPVAPDPAGAALLLSQLRRDGVRYRIGYTCSMRAGARASAGRAIRHAAGGHRMAVHGPSLQHGLVNWKREHAQGGGVLRYFGIHLVAMLARLGYDSVARSALEGDDERHPQRWTAELHGAGLPPCRVDVDSKSEDKRFEIVARASGEKRALVALSDPFEEEPAVSAGADRASPCWRGCLPRSARTMVPTAISPRPRTASGSTSRAASRCRPATVKAAPARSSSASSSSGL